jgi:carbon monoxide dehydrogenase subunit G
MEIKNEFTVSVPIDRAWAVLTDLAGIAPCLPGAQLTGQEGETYMGKVRIKVGPVISEFAGTAAFIEKDDANYRAVIEAKGSDRRGSGNASATITAGLRPDGDRTVVSVDTDLSISGKVAQFGKSAINEVSQKLLGQFVDCLEAKLTAGEPASSETTPVGAEAPTPAPASSEVTPGGAEAPAPASPSVPAPVQAEPEALDLMSIAGGAVYKRLIPVVVVGVVVVAVVIFLLVR